MLFMQVNKNYIEDLRNKEIRIEFYVCTFIKYVYILF